MSLDANELKLGISHCLPGLDRLDRTVVDPR